MCHTKANSLYSVIPCYRIQRDGGGGVGGGMEGGGEVEWDGGGGVESENPVNLSDCHFRMITYEETLEPFLPSF